MKKVDIPLKVQKFYGQGTMLHPDEVMVEELLHKIPYGKVSTVEALCNKMAHDHNTNVTCPMRTSNFIKRIGGTAAMSETSIPFWRIVRNNHLLINSPSTEMCAMKLKEEGFAIDQNSEGEFKVLDIEKRLFSFSRLLRSCGTF